jgi:hypothetical protein
VVKNFSIKNNKLCKTNPISEKQKMNLSSYTTKTYGNKSRLLTMAKQTQSNPICSELACPEQVPISRDASKGSNLPVVSLSNLFYRHSVWRKFIKNPLEFLIDFSSNQLWHKSLKQNQPRQISAIQAIWRTIGAISRAFRVLFGSNSRVIRDNWRYGAKKFPPCGFEKFSPNYQSNSAIIGVWSLGFSTSRGFLSI